MYPDTVTDEDTIVIPPIVWPANKPDWIVDNSVPNSDDEV